MGGTRGQCPAGAFLAPRGKVDPRGKKAEYGPSSSRQLLVRSPMLPRSRLDQGFLKPCLIFRNSSLMYLGQTKGGCLRLTRLEDPWRFVES